MNCKPGDLAIIVRCDYIPEVIGVVVSVVCRGRDSFGGMASWHVQFPDRFEVTDRSTGRRVRENLINFPDAWLRAISGVPVHDEQHDEVTA
ncbi:conserved hypothetical protein [Cupriavidus phytorum]|uniref:Uncharacterized protein n=1 Tax=Cupriavidus taiwanensis TaxID=164546 RepID=A0A375C9C3_9BURK|nr:conserved hypothetical protein [Cupriavidus taiwanensis]